MEIRKKAKIDSSLTVLLVSDLKKSQEFYQKVLGCDVTEFWAVRDDFRLGFKLIEAEKPEDVHPHNGTWNTYAYVEDFEALDALYKELKANCAPIALEPAVTSHEWGLWKEFSIKDPDGYLIGFGTAKKD